MSDCEHKDEHGSMAIDGHCLNCGECAKRPDEAFVGGRIVCYPIEHDFSPTYNREERPILFCRKCGTTQNL